MADVQLQDVCHLFMFQKINVTGQAAAQDEVITVCLSTCRLPVPTCLSLPLLITYSLISEKRFKGVAVYDCVLFVSALGCAGCLARRLNPISN